MNKAHFEDRFVVVDNTEIKYIRHGRIRHVGTPEILVTYGVQEKDLVYVSAADILTLKPGPLVPPNYDSRSWYSPDSTTFSEMRSLMVSVAKGKGIEIGPGPHALQFPLQCEVSYLDSYTIEQQHERTWFGYAESSIMPTDIKGSWEDLALMEKDSLDFIAASHVIEHLRNPIKGLVTAFNCLKEGGFLFLVVPDKRYMFDCHRELTTLDHMINDWTNPCDLRDFEHYQDFYQNAAGDPNWIQRAHAEHDAGMDIHFHTFIPSSFCSLLLYLKDNFVLNYKSLWWQPKIESDNLCQEFYIAIRK